MNISDALRGIHSSLEEDGERVARDVEKSAKNLKMKRTCSCILWGLLALTCVAFWYVGIRLLFKSPAMQAVFTVPIVVTMFFAWRYRVRKIKLPVRLPERDFEAELGKQAHLIWDIEETEYLLRNCKPIDYFEIRHRSLISAYQFKGVHANPTVSLGHFLVLLKDDELFTVFTEYHQLEVIETNCEGIKRARRDGRTCVIELPVGYFKNAIGTTN